MFKTRWKEIAEFGINSQTDSNYLKKGGTADYCRAICSNSVKILIIYAMKR